MPLTPEDIDKVAVAARNAILSAEWTPTASIKQAIGRTYERSALLFDLVAGVTALDLEGVSEAELDERVAELATVIAAQPAAFIAKLKERL